VVLELGEYQGGEYQGSACLRIGSAEHLFSSSLPEPFDGLGLAGSYACTETVARLVTRFIWVNPNRPVGQVDGSLSGTTSCSRRSIWEQIWPASRFAAAARFTHVNPGRRSSSDGCTVTRSGQLSLSAPATATCAGASPQDTKAISMLIEDYGLKHAAA
jgi:hypothetical protein